MSEPQHREWRFYIDDMIGFADRVLAYTDGMDQATFVASALTYDATLRNLELIGEAASRIPAAVREELLALAHRHTQSPHSRLSRHRR